MSRVFSGSNYLYSGVGDYLAGLGAITISSWVWRGASGETCAPLGCGSGAAYLLSLYWYGPGPDNRLYMDVRNGTNVTGSSLAITSIGWHHIAGTFEGSLADGARYKVFYDGDDVTNTQNASGQPTTTATYGLSDQSLRLGRIGALAVQSASATRQAYTQVFNTALNRTGIRESMRFPRRIAGSTTCLNSWALDTSNSVGSSSPGGGVWERDMTGRRDMDSYTTTHSSTNPPIMVL